MVGPAGQLHRALPAGPCRVGDLVDGPGERADLVEPPPDVDAPVAPREPAVAADGQHHVATGAGELVGELHAGGGGADDQDATVGELVGVAVRRGGDLSEGWVEPGGHGRDAGLVAPPGGDHDVGGPPVRVVGLHGVAVVDALEGADRAVLVDRRGEGGGVVGQVGGELGRGHVAVGARSLVAPAREPGGPVGCQEPQRLPAMAPPTLGDAAALEHDVVDVGVGEAAAHGETGLAGADHEGVGGGHWGLLAGVRPAAGRTGRVTRSSRRRVVVQPASTAMATGTPLVRTSKTADRLRDCSTTVRSFSGSSPRRVKLTRICW